MKNLIILLAVPVLMPTGGYMEFTGHVMYSALLKYQAHLLMKKIDQILDQKGVPEPKN